MISNHNDTLASLEPKPVIYDIFNSGAYFNWGWEGCGFGQLSFGLDPETNAIYIGNECMSKDAVRKILYAYVDHIVDNGILDSDRKEDE